MGLRVGEYTFEGPYTSTESLWDNPGVYLILCDSGEKHHPIDVGESKTVKSRVEDHERKPCWSKNCNSTLVVAVFYTPDLDEAGRRTIEQEIRGMYNFPCGEW
jgi:hypothetical protein